jgi:hypothetical protein
MKGQNKEIDLLIKRERLSHLPENIKDLIKSEVALNEFYSWFREAKVRGTMIEPQNEWYRQKIEQIFFSAQYNLAELGYTLESESDLKKRLSEHESRWATASNKFRPL